MCYPQVPIEYGRILTEEDFERIRKLRHRKLVEDAMRKHGLKSAAKRERLLAEAEDEAEEALAEQARRQALCHSPGGESLGGCNLCCLPPFTCKSNMQLLFTCLSDLWVQKTDHVADEMCKPYWFWGCVFLISGQKAARFGCPYCWHRH
jgi:hypothetical protein